MSKVKITDTKYKDNVKLLKQLESSFKRTINWNKYQFKKANQAQNRYLDFLIEPGFQGVNKFFVLSFKKYFLPIVNVKNHNVKTNGINFLIKQ